MSKLKWCIKRTPENADEVNAWANKQPNNVPRKYHEDSGYVYSEMIHGGPFPYATSGKFDSFHEITLDEFRLLTDPGKYEVYSFYGPVDTRCSASLYHNCIKERVSGHSIEARFPIVSEPVFNELQRMWKEKEGQSEDDKTTVYSRTSAELSKLTKKMQEAMATGGVLSEADEQRAKELYDQLKEIDSAIPRSTGPNIGNYTNGLTFQSSVLSELKQITKRLKKIKKLIKKRNQAY